MDVIMKSRLIFNCMNMKGFENTKNPKLKLYSVFCSIARMIMLMRVLVRFMCILYTYKLLWNLEKTKIWKRERENESNLHGKRYPWSLMQIICTKSALSTYTVPSRCEIIVRVFIQFFCLFFSLLVFVLFSLGIVYILHLVSVMHWMLYAMISTEMNKRMPRKIPLIQFSRTHIETSSPNALSNISENGNESSELFYQYMMGSSRRNNECKLIDGCWHSWFPIPLCGMQRWCFVHSCFSVLTFWSLMMSFSQCNLFAKFATQKPIHLESTRSFAHCTQRIWNAANKNINAKNSFFLSFRIHKASIHVEQQ